MRAVVNVNVNECADGRIEKKRISVREIRHADRSNEVGAVGIGEGFGYGDVAADVFGIENINFSSISVLQCRVDRVAPADVGVAVGNVKSFHCGGFVIMKYHSRSHCCCEDEDGEGRDQDALLPDQGFSTPRKMF